jgi:hypothetical protein
MRKLFYVFFLFLLSCSKETPPTPVDVSYTLIASASSGGSVNPTGGTYAANTAVTVTATPNTGYVFSHWTGNANGNDNPLSISMTGNKSIQASFVRQQFTLEVNVLGEGSVSQSLISTSKTTQDYTAGSVVRLLASPSSGWLFSGWSGAIDGSDNPYDVTINEAKTITANFQERQAGEAVVLEADGPGGTYDLIISVLAPGWSPIEVPDCNHAAFGDHIDELYDENLAKHVFRFYMHPTPDNDRCINFDRQRNEIKSYDKSPENLLGRQGEQVTYRWKFKLPAGFQSSPKFTHIHQIKSVGGDYDSMPMYTFTTRKGSPDQLELRYAETENQVTLTRTDLAPFIGQWVEATETILYGVNGTYNLELRNALTQEVLLSYANPSIVNWRPEASFARPKWGVYRSLEYAEDLRDEAVLFADFSVTEE